MSRRLLYAALGVVAVVTVLYLLGVPLPVMLGYGFLLICPLMMVVMMGQMAGMGHGHGHGWMGMGHTGHRAAPPPPIDHERLP